MSITNEGVDSRIKLKTPGILGKLDIENQYYHVNWSYLLPSEDVGKNGLGQKWLRWIYYCISTVKFSVLINGALARFFNTQRSLRQGDPFVTIFVFSHTMEE